MNAIDLSPIQFFLAAGEVGKFVMLLLFAASIWCWVLIIEGIVGIVRFKSALRAWQRGVPPALLASVIEVGEKAASLRLPGESIGETRLRLIETLNRQAQLARLDHQRRHKAHHRGPGGHQQQTLGHGLGHQLRCRGALKLEHQALQQAPAPHPGQLLGMAVHKLAQQAAEQLAHAPGVGDELAPL